MTDVSRLFTKINFETQERDKYFDQIPDSIENYNLHLTKDLKVAGFKFRPKESIYSDLDEINELVYTNQSRKNGNM